MKKLILMLVALLTATSAVAKQSYDREIAQPFYENCATPEIKATTHHWKNFYDIDDDYFGIIIRYPIKDRFGEDLIKYKKCWFSRTTGQRRYGIVSIFSNNSLYNMGLSGVKSNLVYHPNAILHYSIVSTDNCYRLAIDLESGKAKLSQRCGDPISGRYPIIVSSDSTDITYKMNSFFMIKDLTEVNPDSFEGLINPEAVTNVFKHQEKLFLFGGKVEFDISRYNNK